MTAGWGEFLGERGGKKKKTNGGKDNDVGGSKLTETARVFLSWGGNFKGRDARDKKKNMKEVN